MKERKAIPAFVFILVISLITARFLFLTMYVKSQKHEFRRQLLAEGYSEVKHVKISYAQLFRNTGNLEWKEHNKELVINGIYHEVIALTRLKDHVLVYIIEDKAENTLFQTFFCLNRESHPYFLDLLKLFFNLSFLHNYQNFYPDRLITELQKNTAECLFADAPFYSRLIKPPIFFSV